MFEERDDTDHFEGQLAYTQYNKMMVTIATVYKQPLPKVVAAFCALSPNNDYIGNLRSLISLLEGWMVNKPIDEIIVSTYKHCLVRAADYLGYVPFETPTRGLKILNFYRNILNPRGPYSVTIDGHIAAAYIGNKNLVMKDIAVSKNQYHIISRALFELARQNQMLACDVQAIIWFTRKRTLDIKYSPKIGLFDDPNDKWRIYIPLTELPAYD